VNLGRTLRTALLCWSVDERGPDKDRTDIPVTPCVQGWLALDECPGLARVPPEGG